ncbi:lamin tail domain-containing protein [Sorangium sp. So ce1036]|uniref:lamin tail domain-containing protein n=1 Tax=Sorangium sp. So ce1036 TaxID=3133328 RepID=UPI003F0C81F3
MPATTLFLKRYAAVRLPLLVAALAGVACTTDALPDGRAPEVVVVGERSDALSTRVRLMAANITSGRYQSYDPGHGMRILQGVKPDIALLQELNYGDNSAADLGAFVTATFGAGFSYYREGGAQIPNGIVSRWPIVAAGEWDDPRVGNRDFAWARIDIPGPVDLWAISVHFLTANATERDLEAQSLVSFIDAHVPEGDYLVIGGDFNTGNRSESCLSTLSSVVVTSGPYPADQNGNTDTNAGRTKPYDWLLVDPDLSPFHTSVVIGGSSFANGLVVDTRVYTPLAEISPALWSDSGSQNMQHMGVVRDFVIPSDGGTGSGGGGGSGGGTGSGGSGGGAGAAVVILNEVLANEPGSNPIGEFVEVVNVGDEAAALGGFTLHDSTGITRHTFAAGTTLAPSTAILVYGSASGIPAGVSGAVGASSGALGLNNGGDTVTLRDALGATVDAVTYSSALASQNGVSMNRNPDATPGTPFVLHGAFGADASPGRRADGSAF